MKKFVALCMMVMALGFVTVGCGDGSTPAPATDSTAPADSGAPADAAPADAAAPVDAAPAE